MKTIPIQAITNQELVTIVDSNRWNITIKETEGVMAVSLSLNDVVVLSNARAVANTPIIPAQYLEDGNFMFITQNQELPYYTSFNVTQSLVYFSAAELVTAREPVDPPITESYFNPIASLPLRFAPQDY